eukprot:2800713-Alexandrium_andersonii.AAC.1
MRARAHTVFRHFTCITASAHAHTQMCVRRRTRVSTPTRTRVQADTCSDSIIQARQCAIKHVRAIEHARAGCSQQPQHMCKWLAWWLTSDMARREGGMCGEEGM